MAIDLKAGIDHAAFVKDVERGMRKANAALSKRANTLKLKLDDKGFRQPLGRISGDLNMFDSALAASNARVIAFGASTAVIGGISKAFKDLAKTTIVVAKQFADINRILSLSNKNFEKFGNELFNISQKNATAFQDTTKAALEFARQGLKTEETLKRTSDALTLVRLTGINADKAVATLTATVNAFEGTMLDTTTAVNKFVAVETKFAVGARDLVEAVGRVGSSARDAKVGFDELNAMVTSVQQTTGRGGAVIGNAMKTIFTRLQRQSTLEALESYNVAVRDIQGNTLPAMQILNSFAQSYAGLADASQSYLREQVAGVFQANILSAILKDLNKEQSTYSSALNVSTNATNESNQATAQLNKTLSSLVTQTGLEFQRLQENIGKATFEPIAKELLAPLKGLMKGISDLIDGEGAGSEIANGLLKGIRNVLGGPGLIAALGLIGKVFLNTTSYILQSLPALAGITTETQKRATLEKQVESILQRESGLALAIQGYTGNTAMQAKLLADYAQLAADDMDRQEASIQGIANALTRMPKGALNVAAVTTGGKAGKRGASGFIPGMAGEVHDIKRGVGGVSSSAKPVTIPNFAFGGGVRGTMIANTGEHIVPNFKGGGSAIFNPNMIAQYGMPAGAKPIRGAGGYVPNFADLNRADALRELEGMKISGRGYSEGDKNRAAVIGGMFGVKGKGLRTPSSVHQQISRKDGTKAVSGKFLDATSVAHMLIPQAGAKYLRHRHTFGRGKGGPSKAKMLAKSITGKDVDGVILNAYGPSPSASKKVQGGGNIMEVEKILDDSLSMAAENVIMAYHPSLSEIPIDKKKIETSFLREGGEGAMGAFKGALFEAIVTRLIKQPQEKGKSRSNTLDVNLGHPTAGPRTRDLFGIPKTDKAGFADLKSSWSSGNRSKIVEQIIKNFGPMLKTSAAQGYIPNFAALGDSVERELAAGVPMGSIRVGRSSKLAGPNNPAGLGVTNTRDEPRGLADVVGASRGYVPNYASPEDFLKGVVGAKNPVYKKVVQMMQEFGQELTEGKITQDQYNANVKGATQKMRMNSTQMTKVNNAAGQYAMAAKQAAKSSKGGGMGGLGVGMGLAMGLPMAAGMAEQAGAGRAITGAMTGAGTGASIGMMFGPLGAVVGAAVGGLGMMAFEANKVGLDFETLSTSLQEFERDTQEQTNAAEEYIKAQKDLASATTETEFEDAQKRVVKNFDAITNTDLQNNFAAAGTNVDQMTTSLKSYSETIKKEAMFRRAMTKGASVKEALVATEETVQTGTQPNFGTYSTFQTPTYGIKVDQEKRALLLNQVFGDFFKEGMIDKAGAQRMQDAAKQLDSNVLNAMGIGDESEDARKKLLDEMSALAPEAFSKFSEEEKESIFNPEVIKAMRTSFVAAFGITEGLLEELQKLEDKMKPLNDSLIAANRRMSESIDGVKSSTLLKFKDSFIKLNSALSSIGSDIRTAIGDEVGAARFRADAANRGRMLTQGATRREFGLKAQSELFGESFKKEFSQSDSIIKMMESLSNQFLQNPQEAVNKLRTETQSGIFAKGGKGQLPDAANFRERAAKVIRDFEIQEKNIATQNTIVTSQQKIEEIKAKNLVMERDLQASQKLALTKRENVTKLEQMRIEQEINMMQKRSQDPARSRGLTNRENTDRLLADQEGVLQKQIQADEARVKADLTNLKMELEMQKTLIKSNLDLIGADEKLIEATERLASVIVGQALGQEFDKGLEAGKTGLMKGPSSRQDFIDANLKDMGFIGISSAGGSSATGSTPKSIGAGSAPFMGSNTVSASKAASIQKQIIQLEKQYNEEVKGTNAELKKRTKNLKDDFNFESGVAKSEAKRNTEFSSGLQDGFDAVFKDTDQIFNKLGRDLPSTFKNGMVGAMESVMDKTDSFSDAMRGVAIDMLKTIRRASLESSMSNLTSLIGMGVNPKFRNSPEKKQSGGAFVPGTGSGDRVPAMLEPGEYVMNRKAVSGIGRKNLDKMNFGAFPRFATGGSMGLDESVHSSRMSGYFLASDNPELAEAREAERERLAKKAQKKAEKKALKQQLISTFISAGIGQAVQMGSTALKNRQLQNAGATKLSSLPNSQASAIKSEITFAGGKDAYAMQQGYSSWMDLEQSGALLNPNTSSFLTRQKGGHIGGGFTNRDSVPAYMAGGEFVMNNRAVRKYGLGFMGRLNGGLIPAMQAGGGVEAAPLNAQTGANTNNISINVSVGGGAGEGSTSQGASDSTGNANASQQSNVDEATKAKAMSERIRAAVLEVIGQEQRLGGSLSKNARQA